MKLDGSLLFMSMAKNTNEVSKNEKTYVAEKRFLKKLIIIAKLKIFVSSKQQELKT